MTKAVLAKERGSVRWCGQPLCGQSHIWWKDGRLRVCRGPRRIIEHLRVIRMDLRTWWGL